ncbi:MAG: N-acetylmuramoyl-L-alanine amidase [Spirochaetia bacterium]|nr:N-acetylmuramoyl-L-alanine amidase [Spirochaetia bacterium]
MKKVLLAAVMLSLAAAVFAAQSAPVYVDIAVLKKEGFTIEYNRETITAVVRGNSGEARVILNYPFVVSATGALAKIDAVPYTDQGKLFITELTVREIKLIAAKEATPGLAAPATETPEPYYVKQADTATPTIRPTPVKETVKPADTPVIEQAQQEPVIVETRAIKKFSSRKLIVIDPGHGGRDPGAIGATGLQEKDVVLTVAQRVKAYLEGQPVDVVLTRDTDNFVTLKNRAVLANSRKADLFVSIHCNSSRNTRASGTRTYIYSRVASSKEAAAAAKYENKEVGAFEFLLNDLRKSAYEYLSIEAAGNIQHNVTKELKLKWEPTERAPFYVLANTNMPSVLVEIAFISNGKEEARMKEYTFKDKVAAGIAAGIKQYLDKIK